MKTYFFLTLVVLFNYFGFTQQTYVPDDNFEHYLETHDANGNSVAVGAANSMGNGTDNDDYVTTANINTVTNLNVSNLDISDLTGIEDFTDLEVLNCRSNSLTSLDVSQNTALNNLSCATNQLPSLDVTNNTNLIELRCSFNQLPSLDVTNNTNLIELRCGANSLNSLDVSQNVELRTIHCYNNQLTSLDVSQNTALTNLNCDHNSLTSLDVTNNTNLTRLQCATNQLTSLDVTNSTALEILYCHTNQLTSLDVSQNIDLRILICFNNQLTSINMANGNNINLVIGSDVTRPGFSANNNPDLTCIQVDDAAYMDANFPNAKDTIATYSENCHYEETYVPDNYFEHYLETHDANGNSVAVGAINSMGNGIADDDYVTTANINTVTDLHVNNLDISDLTGIEDFTDLEVLNCRSNSLPSLDVSQNTALTNFECGNNQLTSLDVSQNTALIEFGCGNNQLTSLDTANNIALMHLYCSQNSLHSLNVTNNTALTELECNNNQLTNLNLKNGHNTEIDEMGLDLTSNPDLTCIQVDDAAYSTTNWTNIDPASSFSENCLYEETYVPDNYFEHYLETHDANGNSVAVGAANSMGNGTDYDDYVTTANINTVTDLNVNNQNISDLTGIEDFTDLEVLNCRYNSLTSLDVSQNTALTNLNCNYNSLISLDVSQNTALIEFRCSNNQLNSLDVAQNVALEDLSCDNNQLSNLDVTHNTNLVNLDCYRNQLTNLDVSNNTVLIELSCLYNQLTSLDVSNNTVLIELSCEHNQLTSLDVSHNTALEVLYCDNNQLTSLNMANGNNTNLEIDYFYATSNPNLTCIQVDDATFMNEYFSYAKDDNATYSEDCNPELDPNNFVTTWKTDIQDPSSTQITIPTFNGATYNYDIDWNNDGVFDTLNITGNKTHTYPNAGTYTVRIRGDFPRIYFNNDNDNSKKIVSVDQWGNQQWSSMKKAFYGCANLHINDTNAPILSNLTNMAYMFNGCTVMNEDINNWDTSSVTDMSDMFTDCIAFNQPLNNWDTSSVTDMNDMFSGAIAFNQPLDNWNVSKVINMRSLFDRCNVFNQEINNWDVEKVESMEQMFSGALAFNQPIDNWIITNVETMFEMFSGAIAFNQPLNNWDITNVSSIDYMFLDATSFNQPLDNWDVSHIESMVELFSGATSFDQDLGGWDIQSLDDAELMFDRVTLSTENYDSLLIGWQENLHNNNVAFGGGHSKYCQGEEARQSLIDNDGWSITDGGRANNCDLACANIVSPIDGATSVSLTAHIDWEISPDATGYKISIGTSINGNEIENELDLGNTTTYIPTTNWEEGITYYVKVTAYNDNGNALYCESTSFTTRKNIFIPNAFTPNDDGINDTYNVINIEALYPDYVLYIYDRWGSEVYKGKNGWDGVSTNPLTFSSRKVRKGAYYLIVDLGNGDTLTRSVLISY